MILCYLSIKLFEFSNLIYCIHVTQTKTKRERKKKERKVDESVAAISWCAIVLSYLIPFRNLLDGRRGRKRR